MKIHKNTSNNDDNNNIFWITMTDLMTGLVLVFIVMFFYAFISGNLNNIKNETSKENASKLLQENLNDKSIKASVDPVSGVVKISDLELFEVNSYSLSPKGKAYLSKFAPSYFNFIFSNDYLSKNTDKIVIQGHTDSQTFKGKYSRQEQYMKNMELSLNRAFAVADYMTKTKYDKVNSEKLKKMIIVEGASYSEPVIFNGKEDYAKSRRVELKLVMKQKNE